MSSLLLLIVCLVLGLSIARYARPPAELAKHLNWWVLNIALPAAVLQLVPHLKFDRSLWFLPVSMWLMFIVGWGLFHWLGIQLKWSRQRVGALVLTGGLSNTAFVGYPLIEALRGKQALPYAVLADQLGSFLAIAILGSMVTAVYAEGRPNTRLIVRRIVRFPPSIALVIGVIVGMSPGWPVVVDEVLGRFAATLAPLAIFTIGLQLRLHLAHGSVTPLVTALGWKLGLAPLMTWLLALAFRVPHEVATIALLQSAMGPMVSAAILAEQYDFDPPIANMITGVGVILSFATVALWNLVL